MFQAGFFWVKTSTITLTKTRAERGAFRDIDFRTACSMSLQSLGNLNIVEFVMYVADFSDETWAKWWRLGLSGTKLPGLWDIRCFDFAILRWSFHTGLLLRNLWNFSTLTLLETSKCPSVTLQPWHCNPWQWLSLHSVLGAFWTQKNMHCGFPFLTCFFQPNQIQQIFAVRNWASNLSKQPRSRNVLPFFFGNCWIHLNFLMGSTGKLGDGW